MNSPNFVTLFRIPFLYLIVYLIYLHEPVSVLLVPLLFFMDFIDGFLARKTGKESKLGAVLDIAVDRIIEVILWVYFMVLGMVPVWVPAVIITRGILSDGVRAGFDRRPFDIMERKVSRKLVSSRISRGMSGFLKIFTFTFLTANYVLSWGMETVSMWLIYATVAYTVLRGLPVLYKLKDMD